MKKNCRSSKKKEERNNNSTVAVIEEVQDALLLLVDCFIDSWVMDSGVSFHTTTCYEIMENYLAENYGKVYLSDGEPTDIVGIGDVNFRMSNGSIRKIPKVKHVLKLMRNLMSVGQLDDEGHNVTFRAAKVTKEAMVVA